MKIETVVCQLAQRGNQVIYESIAKDSPPQFFCTVEEMVGIIGRFPVKVFLRFSDRYEYSEATQSLPIAYLYNGQSITRHMDWSKDKGATCCAPHIFEIMSGALHDIIRKTRISCHDPRFYVHYKELPQKG